MPITGLDRMPGSGLARGTLFDKELNITTLDVATGTFTTSIVLEKAAENKYTINWTQPSGDDRILSIPALSAADTFTFNAATQTLTNKTLTSPTISGGSATGLTDLDMTAGNKTILDTIGSNTLTIGAGGTTVVIAGNLTVSGTTTTVNSNTVSIADALILLNRDESGTPSHDSGYIIERGSSTNVGLIWDESADEWAAINTSSTGTEEGDVTIASYADFQAATVTAANISAFTLDGKLTAGSSEIEGSAFDINGGTVDAITSLTVANNVDIGAYDLRAATITPDGLTSGRVVFAGTNGVLSDDSDFTFSTDTLTVTKIGAFTAAGAIDFDNQNMTNVDIDSGDMTGVTISGALTWSAAQNLNSQALTNVNIDSGAVDGVTVGTNSAVTELQVDNININGNTIISTDSNGDITLTPNGTGEVNIAAGNLNYAGTAVTATGAELNIMDGGTGASSFTIATDDQIIVNDGGTMKQIAMSALETFMESNLDTLNSVTSASSLTTVGALNAGSITSGFGAIDNGSSAITTTGTITGGAVTVDDINLNGKVLTMTGSTSDTVTMTAATNGAFSLVTVDDAGTDASIQIIADGTVDIDSAVGDAITLDSGAAINLEPAAGSAILLDGTISIDAGVVTGATSITSSAYNVGSDTLAEYIADTVGAMVNSNTESGITVAYQDGDNTLDFTVGTLNQDTTGTADNITVSANNSADETVYPIFVDGATGSQGAESDTGLTYNPSSGLLTAGALDISGNVDIDGTTNLDAVDIDGNVQLDGTLTVGASDTGHDVKFYGATANDLMHWDESRDSLLLLGGAKLGVGSEGFTPVSELELYSKVYQTAPTLTMTLSENAIVDNTVLANIDFRGSDTDGSGNTGHGYARVGARIKAVADETWGTDADDNPSRLEFMTQTDGNTNELATRMTIDKDGKVTIGSDGTGYDVTFFGATANKNILWDASADRLEFADSTYLSMGTDADMIMYHTGSNFVLDNNTGNMTFENDGSDADIIFKGNDGGSDITALTLDMSEAGAATFNSAVDATNFKINGAQGSDGQVLTSTGSGVAWEAVALGTLATLQVDNININGNTISSTDSNGAVTLDPNGTGDIRLWPGTKVDVDKANDIDPFHIVNSGYSTRGTSLTWTARNAANSAISMYQAYDGENKKMHFGPNNFSSNETISSPTLTVDADAGLVGIGTASPSSTLEVVGTVNSQSANDANSVNFRIKNPTTDSSHIEWVLSKRSDNEDMWLYGYDGSTYKNVIKFDWGADLTEFTGGVQIDGNRSVTPGDGSALHVDSTTVTDSNTSASATVAAFSHVTFEGPVLAATNSSVTTTTASTVKIVGAPTAGTNQTFTNAWGLHAVGGQRLDNDTHIWSTGKLYLGGGGSKSSYFYVADANAQNVLFTVGGNFDITATGQIELDANLSNVGTINFKKNGTTYGVWTSNAQNDTRLAPTGEFDVHKAGAMYARIMDTTNSVTTTIGADGSGTDFGMVGTSTADAFQIWAGNAARIYIDSGGQVGVGVSHSGDTYDYATLAVQKVDDTVLALDRVDENGSTSNGGMIRFYSGGSEVGLVDNQSGTLTYGTFTGSHIASTEESIEFGMLVSMTGTNGRWHDQADAEILYGVVKSTTANDSNILGTYLGLSEPKNAASVDNPHLIAAVGNGPMWLVDKGANIAVGDYLISSDVAGHAMKDDGTNAVSYVIGRATEAIDWSTVSDTVGSTKHKKITVTYENFKNLEGRLAALEARVTALE